jgi:hypothetical protein
LPVKRDLKEQLHKFGNDLSHRDNGNTLCLRISKLRKEKVLIREELADMCNINFPETSADNK